MGYVQTITPNPNIRCEAGQCLKYVRQTFGLPGGYPTATAGWNASPTKHRDQDFPPGVWLPLWFSLSGEPAGHVVLRSPDGSIYSTSDYSTIPHHHPSLSDLMRYYAKYGMILNYLGWTEDVQDIPIVTPITISPESTTVLEDILATLTDAEKAKLMLAADRVLRYLNAPTGDIPEKVMALRVDRKGGTRTGTTSLGDTISYLDSNLDAVRDELKKSVKA